MYWPLSLGPSVSMVRLTPGQGEPGCLTWSIARVAGMIALGERAKHPLPRKSLAAAAIPLSTGAEPLEEMASTPTRTRSCR